MKIGIIGIGAIGAVLARKLSANGHELVVANSKGPETVPGEVLAFGATAGTLQNAISDKDVLIISIPFSQINSIAETIKQHIDARTVIIDTGNYYPERDGQLTEILEGKPESIWVTETLGRPVAKAWNTVPAPVLKNGGYPKGMNGRLAVPFSAENERDSQIAAQLIEETGFDAFHAGSLSESYRIQPGQPSYSTALPLVELQKAVENAHDSLSAAENRNQFMKVMTSLAWPDDVHSTIEISRYLNK